MPSYPGHNRFGVDSPKNTTSSHIQTWTHYNTNLNSGIPGNIGYDAGIAISEYNNFQQALTNVATNKSNEQIKYKSGRAVAARRGFGGRSALTKKTNIQERQASKKLGVK